MRLLIVVPAQDPATGNRVTAARLAGGLAACGHQAEVCAIGADGAGLGEAVARFAPEAALLLHAWRSGAPWLAGGFTLPFAVLLTGTDINHGLDDPAQGPVIAAVLARAGAILAQDSTVVMRLKRQCSQLAGRLHYLPPGITLGDQPFPLTGRLPPGATRPLLLCPAGIRPVKGVIELLELCDPLAAAGARFHLLFCGPLLDAAYGEQFQREIARRPWATWLGAVPPAAMADLLRQADLVVSNSRSEGLPNALAEAATLGRPILASAIPGNAAVVSEGVNGRLFRDATQFGAILGELLADPARRQALSRPDPQRFSAAREAAKLEAVCRGLAAGSTPG